MKIGNVRAHVNDVLMSEEKGEREKGSDCALVLIFSFRLNSLHLSLLLHLLPLFRVYCSPSSSERHRRERRPTLFRERNFSTPVCINNYIPPVPLPFAINIGV